MSGTPEPSPAVEAGGRAKRAARVARAAGVATVLFCVGAVLRASARSPSLREGDAAAASDLVSIFECEDFDDDSLYSNATCKGFDRAACNVHCASGWCLELCEDSCKSGGGAVCASSLLSDVTSLCESVAWEKYTPQRALAGHYPYGRGSDDGDADGCDHHLYCNYCNPTCQNLLNEYPEGKYIAFTNVGPHAMRLLSNLTEICESVTNSQPRPKSVEPRAATPKAHSGR